MISPSLNIVARLVVPPADWVIGALASIAGLR
jgi:hypothetical protein